MNRRKSNGRITAEEANELFQKSLELLDQPLPSLDLMPAADPFGRPPASSWKQVVPTDCLDGECHPSAPIHAPSEPGVAPPAVNASPVAGLLQGIRQAVERLLSATTQEADRRQAAPHTRSTADLATRLEKSLVEASCLAAELQRRHREALAEHQRALNEIRDMVTVLVEQVDRSASPPREPALETVPEITPLVPAGPTRGSTRGRRRARPIKSVAEDAG